MVLRCRVLLTLVAALPLTALAACGSQAAAGGAGKTGDPAASHVVLKEAGSTLLEPLLTTWASAYHQGNPGVTVQPSGGGSGAGIADAAAGRVDLGASDAYLSSGDLFLHPKLLNIPLAISAQQVNYNLPGLAGRHLRLNGTVLAQMYQGTIKTWNNPAIAALNPGVRLPSLPVVPIHRSDSSGDTFLFTSYLATKDPAWNGSIGYGTTVAWPQIPAAAAAAKNSGMVAACAARRGCVAYIGISYLQAASNAGLGYASLANKTGSFVLPDAASISAEASSFVSVIPVNETISMVNGQNAAGYPIVNFEYAIVNTEQPSSAKASALRSFLHWVVTTGNAPQYLGSVHFAPLPREAVKLSEAQIARIS